MGRDGKFFKEKVCVCVRESARWGAGAREDVVQGLLQKGLGTEREGGIVG